MRFLDLLFRESRDGPDADRIRIASIGDSHSLFSYAAIPEIDVFWLGPVTMHRVGRDGFRSLLTYRHGFLPWEINKIQKYDFIIVSFGEIDAREHIEKISNLQSKPIEDVINSLVGAYMKSLADFFDTNTKLVISCVPPTPPGQNATQIVVREILNESMRHNSEKFDFLFFDYRPDCQSDGWLRSCFSEDSVHLNPRKTEFIRNKLSDILQVKLTYNPNFADLFLRPMSARTLRAKYNRTRKRLFNRK